MGLDAIARHWRRLSRGDKRRIAALAILLPLINLSLHLFGTRRTRRWLLHASRSRAPNTDIVRELPRAERLAALAARLGRHGRHQASCLRQALAVEYCLRRDGLPAQLRLGTRKSQDGRMQAHAWVELDGVALAQRHLSHLPIQGAAQLLR